MLRLTIAVVALVMIVQARFFSIVGLFLAVLIMVVAMIVCAHVPSLHPVAVLLSRDGNLFGRDADREFRIVPT
jgi:AI-2 transport protein TqsA